MNASPGLMLDLYHLDSAYLLWRAGAGAEATFDLYVRSHPFDGGYLLVAGLEPALGFVASFGFTDGDIDFIRSCRPYDEAFLDVLRASRFTGEIAAMPEGTVAFADEPLVRVTAPLREALLLESGLMRIVNVAGLIATKAARVVTAAEGRPVAEFGLRRAHAPLEAARAAWIAGCASTSFVGAARELGIPASGTIPHAVVNAFPSEEEAFRAVAHALPEYTLLLDTYDVERAAHTAVRVARETQDERGHVLSAVRLDSGDMAAQARGVRAILDEGGLDRVRILASGDLDEFRVADLVASGAPIDAFGVGTSIAIGAAAPERGVHGGALTCVYKLVAYGGEGVVKVSEDKQTWPGRKQVYRLAGSERDVIALADEPPPEGSIPLLRTVVEQGHRTTDPEPLEAARARAAEQLAALPEGVRRLQDPQPYRVERSRELERLREAALRKQGLG